MAAALLFAVSPVFRVFYALSWSISLLPPLAILTVWAYSAWYKRRRFFTTVLLGVTAGLTLLAHPVGSFLLAGLAFHWLVLATRRFGWGQAARHGTMALVAFAVTYSPAILGGSISSATIAWAGPYFENKGFGDVSLVDRLLLLPSALARIAQAFGGDYALMGMPTDVGRVLAIAVTCLALLGAVTQRQRLHVIAVPILAAVLFKALVFPKPTEGYIAYVFPLGYVMVGAALGWSSTLWRRTLAGVVLFALMAALWWQFEGYYAAKEREGFPNIYLLSDTALLAQESFLIVGDIVEDKTGDVSQLTCWLRPRPPTTRAVVQLTMLLSLEGKLRVRNEYDAIKPEWNDISSKLAGKTTILLTDAVREKLGELVSGWEPLVKRACYGIYRPAA